MLPTAATAPAPAPDHSRAAAYRVCDGCVMDTSDPDITFGPDGRCNHCRRYETVSRAKLNVRQAPGALQAVVDEMKEAGRGRAYDCVIGVSGGLDSTYAAYHAKKLGLRCLAVHIDNGWNTELATANIQQVVDRLDMDLHTVVLDWEEFRDIQAAFFRAGVPDVEIPTDQAILAGLYDIALKEGIRFVISGDNEITEGVSVPAWSQGQFDWRYIRSVHKRHGTRPLRRYPRMTPWKFGWATMVKRIRFVSLLDYTGYDKQKAGEELERDIGWRPYKWKHGESAFTRFFQCYYLPAKFGYDKRRAHLSTLIWAGQITREEALLRLEEPLYAPDQLAEERDYVLKKLGLSSEEFERIVAGPPASYHDFPSYGRWLARFPKVMAVAKRLRRVDNQLANTPPSP